jgi:hypothetical protein
LIVVSESMKTAVSAYTAHPTLERILFTVRTRHERLVSVDVVSDSVSSKALIIAAADYSAIANHHQRVAFAGCVVHHVSVGAAGRSSPIRLNFRPARPARCRGPCEKSRSGAAVARSRLRGFTTSARR